MTNDALLYLQGHAHTHDHTCEHTGQGPYIHVCTDTDTLMHSAGAHVCMHVTTHRHEDGMQRTEHSSLENGPWISDLYAWGIFLLGDGATWGHFAYLQPPIGGRTLIRVELRSFIVNLCGKDIHAYLEVVFMWEECMGTYKDRVTINSQMFYF